jgi:dienelactone hydrolase
VRSFDALDDRDADPHYHEPSARDARRRIVDFFDTHLKP